MAHQKPVTLTLAQAPHIVRWAIVFHAWLLTLLPESYPDRDVVAVIFEEQCLEAYQVGLGWWLNVVVWAWNDVGVTLGMTQLDKENLRILVILTSSFIFTIIIIAIIVVIGIAFMLNLVTNTFVTFSSTIALIIFYLLDKTLTKFISSIKPKIK